MDDYKYNKYKNNIYIIKIKLVELLREKIWKHLEY